MRQASRQRNQLPLYQTKQSVFQRWGDILIILIFPHHHHREEKNSFVKLDTFFVAFHQIIRFEMKMMTHTQDNSQIFYWFIAVTKTMAVVADAFLFYSHGQKKTNFIYTQCSIHSLHLPVTSMRSKPLHLHASCAGIAQRPHNTHPHNAALPEEPTNQMVPKDVIIIALWEHPAQKNDILPMHLFIIINISTAYKKMEIWQKKSSTCFHKLATQYSHIIVNREHFVLAMKEKNDSGCM